jgi:hypothetical protein
VGTCEVGLGTARISSRMVLHLAGVLVEAARDEQMVLRALFSL